MDKKKLIKEEQKKLDELIDILDEAAMKVDKTLTKEKLELKRKKEVPLPELYGAVIEINEKINDQKKEGKYIKKSRDALYNCRIEADVTTEDGTVREDIKIGLHGYSHAGDTFIAEWTLPVCRHYLLDNAAVDFDGVVESDGQESPYHYHLLLKRNVDIHFATVKDVMHLFPVTEEEAEKIIADEFLQELLRRRNNTDFENIVFSIQKRQGQIIGRPYTENLIVQGCAGSGKSMIMMHRLPVILYDNSSKLNRRDIFIVSPSREYIEMVDNMRQELEIGDLRIGTMREYYKSCIERYNVKANEACGSINKKYNPNPNTEIEVYSSGFIENIRSTLESFISKFEKEFTDEMEYFGIKLNSDSAQKYGTLFEKRVSHMLDQTREITAANDDTLKKFVENNNALFEQTSLVCNLFKNRLTDNMKVLKRHIDRLAVEKEEENEKYNLKQEPTEEEKALHQSMLNINNQRTQFYARIALKLRDDKEYIDYYSGYAVRIKELMDQLHPSVAYEKANDDEKYGMVENFYIWSKLRVICEEFLESGYLDEYASDCRDILPDITEWRRRFLLHDRESKNVLNIAKYKEIKEVNKYYGSLYNNIVDQTYEKLLTELGCFHKTQKVKEAADCGPYVYLQILYQYRGTPKTADDKLVSIDEAQIFAEEEFRLIKAVNHGNTVFNLYGDTKQHIEGTKGIDYWHELKDIAHFREERLEENYRNCRQITEFGNQRFQVNMRAINLDGSGVRNLGDGFEEFYDAVNGLFLKAGKPGRSAVIAANEKELQYFEFCFKKHDKKMYKSGEGRGKTLHQTHWNLLTIEQAKGLEFTRVVALFGRMSENESYIACTRALDELLYYDGKLEYSKEFLAFLEDQERAEEERKKEERLAEKARAENKKAQSAKNVENVKYGGMMKKLMQESAIVRDDREKGGFLWVIGPKEKTQRIIDKFDVPWTFVESAKDINNRPGWYTKSKK